MGYAWRILAATVIGLAGTGCWVRSVHPLCGPEDAVEDDRLLGAWAAPSDKRQASFTEPGDTFVIRPAGDKAYGLTYVSGGVPASFVVRLTRLGNALIADVAPKPPTEGHGRWQAHLLAVHSFFRLVPGQRSLETAPLDHDWLAAQLAGSPPALAFTRVDQFVILTAPTEDLRRFLAAHAADPKAFSHPVVLTRL